MANDLVYIKNFQHRYEAEMARSFLESNDIAALVSADDEGGMSPILLAANGGARLIVHRQNAEKALRLLEALESGADGFSVEEDA